MFWEHGTGGHEFRWTLTLTNFFNNWPHAEQAEAGTFSFT
jgi:hypothetical protein